MELRPQPDEGYSEAPLDAASQAGTLAQPMPPAVAQYLAAMSTTDKTKLVEMLLAQLPTDAIVHLASRMAPRLSINFVELLPAEICLQILGYLDPIELIRVAQACSRLHALAVDNALWQSLYLLEGWHVVPDAIEAGARRATELMDGTLARERPAAHADTPHNDDAPRTAKRRAIACDTVMDDDVAARDAPRTWRRTCQRSGAVRTAEEQHVDRLWTLDEQRGQARLNWQYLYRLRWRLEQNWEKGRFRYFRLPHPLHVYEGHEMCIYTLQFDGQTLVSGSRDRTIRVWDMQKRRLRLPPLRGHRGSVLCLQFDASPDQDVIMSGSSDSNIIVWRLSTGAKVQVLDSAHNDPVLNVKFNRDILVTSSKDRSIKIFARRPLRAGDVGFDTVPGEPAPALARVTAVENGEAVQPAPVTVLQPGAPDPRADDAVRPAYSLLAVLTGHTSAVNAVSIHGREVVSAAGDRSVKIWDWPAQMCVRTLVGHTKGVACVQYDGRRVVTGCSDNMIRVFDRLTGLEVAKMRGHTDLVRTVQAGFGDVAYSAHEDAALAARFDAKYREYERSGVLVQHLSGPASRRAPPVAVSGPSLTPVPGHATEHDEEYMMRPENILFTGAKLPPGGGGGQYGRVVSGSYDKTVIVWRRDRRGTWVAQHHLRHQDAMRNADRQDLESVGVMAPLPPVSELPTDVFGAPRSPEHDAHALAVVDVLDAAMRAGLDAVQQVLVDVPALPALASLRFLLECVMDADADVDADVDTNANLGAVMEGARATLDVLRPGWSVPGEATRVTADVDLPADVLAHMLRAVAYFAAREAATVAVDVEAGMEVAAAHAKMDARARQHAESARAARDRYRRHLQELFDRPDRPLRVPGLPEDHELPARVFKLQYDARRIVCCSETAIVGWDFCAGDAELEAASAYFATVE